MTKAKVYFSDMRTRYGGLSLPQKLGKLIEPYQDNIIEVEGHTDNVPIHSAKYEDNDVLSFYRARAVTDYLSCLLYTSPSPRDTR